MVFCGRKVYSFKFIFFLFIAITLSQPRAKYRPFDWLLFKEPGKINSISEGYEFLYIGTSHGGIYRYNLYGNQYDFPITTAQGLDNNNINSVHFDHSTGIIWASSTGVVQYSFTREGDWRIINQNSTGKCSPENCKMYKLLYMEPDVKHRLKADILYKSKAKKISVKYYLNNILFLEHIDVPISKKFTDGSYGPNKPYIKIGIYRIGDTGTTTFTYDNFLIKNKKM